MTLSSTRWTSTRAGATQRAPYGLNGFGSVAQNPLQLQAQWDAFLKEFDQFYNTVSAPARQAILKTYQAWQDYFEGTLGGAAGWSMATSAPNIAPWVEAFSQAQGILAAEKLRGAQAQSVSNQTASGPAIKLQEENVTAKRALAVGLVGIATLLFVLSSSYERV